METLLSIVYALLTGALGAATLFYGRRYFWLSAAAVGFATATVVVDNLVLRGYTASLLSRDLLIALVVAAICGGVVWWLPRYVGMIIGFVFGIYGVVALLAIASVSLSTILNVLLAVAVGFVCARYATWDVDQALIIFSVLLGATMVVRVLPLSLQSPLSGITWMSLLLVGIIAQYSAQLRAGKQAASNAATGSSPVDAAP